MDRSAILGQLRSSLADVLNRDIPELHEQSRLFEDLALDSTSVIELLMSLEDTINLEIDPEAMGPEIFQTVASLADYVQAEFAKYETA